MTGRSTPLVEVVLVETVAVVAMGKVGTTVPTTKVRRAMSTRTRKVLVRTMMEAAALVMERGGEAKGMVAASPRRSQSMVVPLTVTATTSAVAAMMMVTMAGRMAEGMLVTVVVPARRAARAARAAI
jgi:hypothetical protein